jgi:hypothetical protein
MGWTAVLFETRGMLDTFRPLRFARRTNPYRCIIAPVGEAEAGSAGEQPDRGIAGRNSSRTMSRAHPFHRQRALLWRPRSDGLVDAEAPAAMLGRRPSLILSKALLKKSFSNAFSASADFSFVISSRSCLSLRSSAVSQIGVPRLGAAFELVLPGIEKLPLQLQLQLARQRANVFEGLHSFDPPLKLHGMSAPLCHFRPSCHLASIRLQSAPFSV